METRDLLSQIEDRMLRHIEGDPGFAEAQERLASFKLKAGKIQERISKLRKESAEKEKEIGAKVLAGGSSSVSSLGQLREKLVGDEDEERIFKSVVEQAEASLLTIKAKVTREYSITNVQLLAVAIADLCLALEQAHENIQVAHKACNLAYLSGRDWSVSAHSVLGELLELERSIRELHTRSELMKRMAVEVKQA